MNLIWQEMWYIKFGKTIMKARIENLNRIFPTCKLEQQVEHEQMFLPTRQGFCSFQSWLAGLIMDENDLWEVFGVCKPKPSASISKFIDLEACYFSIKPELSWSVSRGLRRQFSAQSLSNITHVGRVMRLSSSILTSKLRGEKLAHFMFLSIIIEIRRHSDFACTQIGTGQYHIA